MNLKELKEIIALFEQANITELDVERQGVKIRLKKGAGGEISQQEVVPASAEVPARETSAGKAEEEKFTEIKAPMVGTFYITSAPGEEPLVEEGDEIEEGQVICIIEAMKLMNEVKSEISGRVQKVLVKSGQAVEFDQPLFLVDTTGQPAE